MSNLLNWPHWVIDLVEENDHDYRISAHLLTLPAACPLCGTIGILHPYGVREQRFMDLPIHTKRVGIMVGRRRFKCSACGRIAIEPLVDMDETHRMSKRLLHFVQSESIRTTFLEVARQCGLDEKTVRDIFKAHTAQLAKTHTFVTPAVLGIDELHLLNKPRCVLTNLRCMGERKMTATLAQRCAAFGWALDPQDDGYELLGNGAPASFRSTESLADWLDHQERTRRRPADGGGAALPAMQLDTITIGDARELAATIPDSSCHLVFADPIYQNIDDYRWLAQVALRVLRPKGLLLAWCSKPKLGRCQLAMEDTGLEYVYTLDYTVQAKTYRMRWYNLFCWTTPCLWMQRPGEASRPRRWIPDTFIDSIMLDDETVEVRQILGDTFISTGGPNGSYIWNKNLGVLSAWLDAFCPIGGTVYDPFCGSGSIPLVAKMTGRHFYASEILPEVAAAARERVEQAPLPLPGMMAEQQAELVF